MQRSGADKQQVAQVRTYMHNFPSNKAERSCNDAKRKSENRKTLPTFLLFLNT